jgi:hypothetical protein
LGLSLSINPSYMYECEDSSPKTVSNEGSHQKLDH